MKDQFTVVAEDEGLRLDQVVPRHLPGLSRRKARAVIDTGGVFVDKTRVKVAGRTVRAGQVIEVNVGGAVERTAPPLAPTLVHLDDHVIVVIKPAGLVTAPTARCSSSTGSICRPVACSCSRAPAPPTSGSAMRSRSTTSIASTAPS